MPSGLLLNVSTCLHDIFEPWRLRMFCVHVSALLLGWQLSDCEFCHYHLMCCSCQPNSTADDCNSSLLNHFAILWMILLNNLADKSVRFIKQRYCGKSAPIFIAYHVCYVLFKSNEGNVIYRSLIFMQIYIFINMLEKKIEFGWEVVFISYILGLFAYSVYFCIFKFSINLYRFAVCWYTGYTIIFNGTQWT